jgi:hypothetical protein
MEGRGRAGVVEENGFMWDERLPVEKLENF